MSMWVRIVLVILSGEVMSDSSTSPIGVAYLSPLGPYPWLLALIAQGPQDPLTGKPEPLTLSQAILLSLIPYAIAGIHMWGLMGFGWQLYSTAIAYLPVAGIIVALLSWPFVRLDHKPRLRIAGMTFAWVMASATRTLPPSYSFPVLAGPPMSDAPPFDQLGALAGPWGLEAFIALVSMLLAEATVSWLRGKPKSGPSPYRWVAWAVAVVAVVGLGGALRLAVSDTGMIPWSKEAEKQHTLSEDMLTVAVIQSSTPNWMHRRAWSIKRLQTAIDANTVDLVHQALTHDVWGKPPDWVVMPESAFGRSLPAGEDKMVKEIQKTLDHPDWKSTSSLFLVMTAMMERPVQPYPRADRKNTVFVVEREDNGPLAVRDRWSKRQLVPIGERRYHPGEPWKPLKTQHGFAGGVICFESLYPQFSESLAEQGAEVLIVFTNDSGQRWSDAGVWHARLGKLRAIELGLSMIHASQTGPSFMIDPYGRKSAELGLFDRGVLRAAVSKKRVWTPYAALGSIGWIAIFGLGWIITIALRLRVVQTESSHVNVGG